MNHRRLDRRCFLQGFLAATVTMPSLLKAGAQTQPATGPYTLHLEEDPSHITVPRDFIGLSYEVMQLEDPSFFSARNTSLVEQFRKLSPHGVLRLGGNTSEFSWWKESDSDTAPVRKAKPANDGEPAPETLYAVTPEAIRELKGFLDATGWACIYGLNLGYGTPETDVREALYVHRTLGDKLLYFQVGNEVDLFWRHLRDKSTWNVQTYLENWLSIARAVQKAIPSARFGMPDVASDVTWLPQIADRWGSVQDKVNVVTLSHHYYFGGPPSNPDVNVERLLRPDPKVIKAADIAKPAAAKMGVGLRMTEGNTCYQGGKPGVSDVFASALWGADYAFTLMQLGYSGVNLHGGSGHAVAVSVGGILRGEKLMRDPNAPHAKPFYTPIARDENGNPNEYHLQPVGYGLKFADSFAGCELLQASLAGADGKEAHTTAEADAFPGVAVFAAKKADGKKIVAILNKKENEDISIRLAPHRILATLESASLEDPQAQLQVGKSSMTKSILHVPAHTAVLVEL